MEALALRSVASFLPWFVQATLSSLVALTALRLGRRRSPRTRHAIVAGALLSFAVPPFLALPGMPSAGTAFGALAGAARPAGPGWVLPGAVIVGIILVWASGSFTVLGAVLQQARSRSTTSPRCRR